MINMRKFKRGDIVRFKSTEWFQNNCITQNIDSYLYRNRIKVQAQSLPKWFVRHVQGILFEVEISRNTYIQVRSISDKSELNFVRPYYLEFVHKE